MPLSVLTLNLWNDAGPWTERAARVRDWIDQLDPDLIGFQEALRAEGRDQLAELLEGRGYHLAYARATPFWREGSDFSHGDFGNAVASRFPITETEATLLPDSGDGEKRSALAATVNAPFGPVSFTCTHLNWKFRHGEVRERQVQAVCDLVLRRRLRGGFPSILVGDFNAEPESAEIRFVTGLQSLGGRSVAFLDAWRTVGQGSGITWSNQNAYARAALEPDRRIDYVFTGFPMRSGVGQLLDCRVVCNDEKDGVWPSDHFGVYAELRSEPLAHPGLRPAS
jgi:endonuclease/exonuclease/phosphatase family metal-dependent hydrolase